MGRAIVAISADHHSGHPFGLFPGESWQLVSGENPLYANPWQLLMGRHWTECWTRIGEMRQGARLIVVTAGDSIEGDHHSITELHTYRLDEQERMFVASMRAGLELASFNTRGGDILRCLSGTVVHDGMGGSSAERIARMLISSREDLPLDGAMLRRHLLLSVNGVLFDIAHQGFSLGQRHWTRSNTMRAYLHSRWMDCLEHGMPMPRYIIRAHKHTAGHAILENAEGKTVVEGWLMPAWKLKDEYIYQVEPEAVSTIGLLVFEVLENGESTPYRMVMRVDQDNTEIL